MKKLIKGIADFQRTSIEEYRSKFSKLAFAQSPDTLFIACCDSRVVPNVFASCDPGDLFVVRNIGNLVPPYQKDIFMDTSVSAAIEFSLLDLKVSDVVICGHSECGAMHSLIENKTNLCSHDIFLNEWLKYAEPSYQRFKNGVFMNDETITPCDHLSRVNVLQQIDNLKTYPLVMDRLRNGTLKIHGWWFDLVTANVYYYNLLQERFILIDEAEAVNILASL